MTVEGERVQILIPRTNQPIEFFGDKITPAELFKDCIYNPEWQGWHFGAGDPEFWRFEDKLVVPGGIALDLGTGFGRTSVPFALRGMRVVGYENDPTANRSIRAMTEAYGLPIEVRDDDITQSDLGQNIYDTVIFGQTFVHFPSKVSALSLIEKAVEATKPGGRLYIRTGGKETDHFQELQDYEGLYPEVTRVDEDVFMAPCTCSGEYRIDPQLYLNAMELVSFMAKSSLVIEHTQIAPEYGQPNILFGENWPKPVEPWTKMGFITVIARKS